MAVWPARTWTPGELVTAGMMNTGRDQLNELHQQGIVTAYTPTVTGFTLGNGVATGKYGAVGSIVLFELTIVWGSTSTFLGTLGIALPPVAAASANHPAGNVIAIGGGGTWGGHAWLATTAGLVFYTGGTNAGAWGSGAPFGWASGNSIAVNGHYLT